jgi:hypothetical protein
MKQSWDPFRNLYLNWRMVETPDLTILVRHECSISKYYVCITRFLTWHEDDIFRFIPGQLLTCLHYRALGSHQEHAGLGPALGQLFSQARANGIVPKGSCRQQFRDNHWEGHTTAVL